MVFKIILTTVINIPNFKIIYKKVEKINIVYFYYFFIKI